MRDMTLPGPKLEGSVSDVDINMMGIKSPQLYHFLKTVIEERGLEALQKVKANEILPDLVHHMSVTIPNDILGNYSNRNENDFRHLKETLAKFGEYLLKNFSVEQKYPFTILRICELCYDPLKYYKIHELRKFVGAISKCCIVRSSWQYFEESDGFYTDRENDEEQGEDVSLTKIPWVDEEAEKELAPFLKEIDALVSPNLGYEEDEEDEDMDVDTNDSTNGSGDFRIEEYYENLPRSSNGVADDDFDDDYDDDDYDDDYVETPTSDDNEQWTEDSIEENLNELDDNNEDERDNCHEDTGSEVVASGFNDPVEESDNIPPSKRKPTELDDFEYKESPNAVETHLLATPKKVKHDKGNRILESPSIIDSDNDENTTPLQSQETLPDKRSRSQSPSSEHHVPILVSPRENYDDKQVPQEGKLRDLMDETYDRDTGSPLSNKNR
ncbi:hypothetical protein HG535_0B04910 [Zygotorulaspora mrakii]|uniref:Serine/threonine-protein phosphatase 4 regulatory subunit 2 n=1 Tax=Zygotorulaspora mrakii TaxID=42260 RepID=A0A7H9B0E9_ZYGMR|nr:uncharacterized protein HG535_0B04910 [Zygotorulaspora mrakii]QLG71449.1 hypothetical protein HG535_0B04910 [Zygotorulaspora mrakii]